MRDESEDPDFPNIRKVKDFLFDLQEKICTALELSDGETTCSRIDYPTPNGGLTRPRVMSNGPYIEKAAVQCTYSVGDALPEAATVRNPTLAGKPFEAASLSSIVHPRNPYAPTVHLNLRMFLVATNPRPSWHFGGGFDLTPHYGFVQDAQHFHAHAQAACAPLGMDVYPRLKAWCDRYFFLPHRQETRGIGGIFFDDWTAGGFAQSFALTRSIGQHFLPAYLPILERRKAMPYTEHERQFQLYRRGRYVEFNLAIDRGTRYGLQSGRRIESVLASLPPIAVWRYNWVPEPGSPEDRLAKEFLHPKDWLGTGAT